MIRPAITYSRMRYQLVTLEDPNTVGRARAGKTVLLPEEAKGVQGTMSWAGDVAMMIARLLFNDRARGEVFTVSTAEHHTWGEIADYYKEICGLKAAWIPKEDFLRVWGIDRGSRWQLECDRLFTRIMDNSKVLDVTGMKQEELRPLFDGLKYEIGRCPRDTVWQNNQAMDDYIAAKGL
jgi:nucleoside-diphosphate-sugar epimerase